MFFKRLKKIKILANKLNIIINIINIFVKPDVTINPNILQP
jgi:hypothetical protein